MNQKKIGNKLYVFSETAYEITQDTDASVILIQQECIDAYKALNSSAVNAKIKPINYKLFCVQTQEWIDYYNDFTVTVGTIVGGTVTASTTSADEGEEITLTQSASTGYEFTSWDVKDADNNSVTVTNNKFAMPASNVTVNAVFDKIDFDITIDNTIQNGTLSAPATANLGDTVTITATPSAGYKLDTLTVMCGSLEVTVVNSQFTMPAGDVTITGTFIQDAIPYEQQYFTIESEADNNSITIKDEYGDTLYISVDNGTTWEQSSDGGEVTKTLDEGEKMLVKANNGRFNIYTDPESITDPIIYGTGNFKVYGNSMSLIYGDNFANQTSFPANISNNFEGLFILSTYLTDASNLILPATTLTDYCYAYMFMGCTALTNAPALPATILANYCYNGMFMDCTALTNAPDLPATTLANDCYSGMFRDCTSLTAAPELPATTLANYCYSQMFYDCTSLNCIKCLATDISASYCTYRWVVGVAASGTFTKAATMSSWTTGADGIPSGWTVQDAA